VKVKESKEQQGARSERKAVAAVLKIILNTGLLVFFGFFAR
jgi:hypothetical protein